jgi:hypothetical protein
MNMFGFVCLQEKALKECGFDGSIPGVGDLGPCAGVADPSNDDACEECIEAACTAADFSGCSPSDPDPATVQFQLNTLAKIKIHCKLHSCKKFNILKYYTR